MASERISELPAAASVADADLLAVVQGGTTKQASRVQVLTAGARVVAADGATVTFDATLGRQQEVTLGGSRTAVFANWADGNEMTIDVIQGGAGSFTLTWPTVRWAGGSEPTLTTTAGKWDTVVIRRRGTEYAGYLAGSNI